jgi:WhiB family redox-sensing transcriptional regulator
MTADRHAATADPVGAEVIRLVSVTDPHEVVWQDLASCAEASGDYWYPEKDGVTREAKTAKRICAACPVRPQCLEFALDHMTTTYGAGMYGIWAGTTVNQRKQMLRQAA